MEVYNESQKTNKVNTLLLILVVVLVVIILLFGAYFLSLKTDDKNINNDNNNGTINNVDDDSSNYVDEGQNGQNGTEGLTRTGVEQLLNKFGFNMNLGCETNIYAYNYSEEFKMLVALNNVSDSQKVAKKCSDIYTKSQYNEDWEAYQGNGQTGICVEENGTKVIAYDTVNSIYKDLYGTDMPKQSVNSLKINSLFYSFYDYDEINNQFVTLECEACGGTCGAEPVTLNKIKTYTETDNQLTVQIYYAEGYTTTEGQYTFKGIDTVNASNSESALKEIESKYLDKVDVYEIIFTKQNGNYLFGSLNKKSS